MVCRLSDRMSSAPDRSGVGHRDEPPGFRRPQAPSRRRRASPPSCGRRRPGSPAAAPARPPRSHPPAAARPAPRRPAAPRRRAAAGSRTTGRPVRAASRRASRSAGSKPRAPPARGDGGDGDERPLHRGRARRPSAPPSPRRRRGGIGTSGRGRARGRRPRTPPPPRRPRTAARRAGTASTGAAARSAGTGRGANGSAARHAAQRTSRAAAPQARQRGGTRRWRRASSTPPLSLAARHETATLRAVSPDASWTFSPGAIVLMLAAHRRLRHALARHGGAPVGGSRSSSPASLAAAAAILSPIDRLAEQLLSMHMVQHILLLDLAPILIILSFTKKLLRPATKRLLPVERAAGFLADPGLRRPSSTSRRCGSGTSPPSTTPRSRTPACTSSSTSR